MMTAQSPTKTLYEQDYYLWLETTAQLLRGRKLHQLDYNNLIEEIESMGRSERRELKNRLIVLLTHLLKWKYQPDKRSDSWTNTIDEQRRQIMFLLEDSPSLEPYYLEIFDVCYPFARKDASKQTQLSSEIFPDQCPFSPENARNFDYLPN